MQSNKTLSDFYNNSFYNFQKIKVKKKTTNKLKISIISDFNTSYLQEAIKKILSYNDIECNFLESEYGSLKVKITNPKDLFWKKKSDLFLILPKIDNHFKGRIDKIFKMYENIWNVINKPVIQTLFPYSDNKILSYQDSVSVNGFDYKISKLNNMLVEKKNKNIDLIDYDYVYKNFLTNKDDTILDLIADQPFPMEALPGLVHVITSNIKGILGMSKKVLILDLDNTLWGGVIGDLGYKKINLNPEDNIGRGFLNFQKYILELKRRGILLAVCSKNNEVLAKEGFLKNKNSILKLKDISVFRANFKSKVENIKQISKILNMPLNNMVFLDDTKFECEVVKNKLSDIEVVELNQDPNLFSKLLEKKLFFYFKDQTLEDTKRSESYKKLEQFEEDSKKDQDLDSFLKKINTRLVFSKVNESTIDRVVQLFAKTNQFNFNKKIFSYKEIEKNKDNFITIEAIDKYQNYGIISVVNYKLNNKNLEIINWVLSCRVFSRYIEFEILWNLIKYFNLNANKIIFNFKKSKKNKYLLSFLNSIEKKKYHGKSYFNFENFKYKKNSYFKITNNF